MSGNFNHGQPHYLCRFPAEYALPNRVDHPKNVYLREADVLGRVDGWLAELFGPASIDATLSQLAEAGGPAPGPPALAQSRYAKLERAQKVCVRGPTCTLRTRPRSP